MTKRTTIPLTHFAPAERLPVAITRRQAARFKRPLLPLELLTPVLNFVFVLNKQLQIVYASRNIPHLMPGGGRRPWMGFRIGEILSCVHATDTEAGCGSSKACQKCGALLAMLESFSGQACLKQFRLSRFVGQKEQNLDFLALAAPIVRDGETFSLLVLADGSDAQSRSALKRLLGEITDTHCTPLAPDLARGSRSRAT
jgi:hypothetical protein